MNILLSPQVRDRDKIWYEIEGQKIQIEINDIVDVFDFTDMPDGELQLWDEEGKEIIYTEDYDFPILSAKKENGELWVEIVFTIDMEEKDERLLFPDWVTLEEFNDLMDELVERKEGAESVDDESDSDDSLEETDYLVEPDEVDDDAIIVEDEGVDGEEIEYKDDYIIDIEEVDF